MTRYAAFISDDSPGHEGRPFGCYEIDSLPSQVGVAICHGFEVFPEYRGQGMAAKLKAHQMETLQNLGYRFAQCTVVADNTRQISTLKRFGWKQRGRFQSTRQGKWVEIWGRPIGSSTEIDEMIPDLSNATA